MVVVVYHNCQTSLYKQSLHNNVVTTKTLRLFGGSALAILFLALGQCRGS